MDDGSEILRRAAQEIGVTVAEAGAAGLTAAFAAAARHEEQEMKERIVNQHGGWQNTSSGPRWVPDVPDEPHDLVTWLRAQLDREEAEHPAPHALPIVQIDTMRAILELHSPRVDHQGRSVCDHCDELCHSRSGLLCDDPDSPYPCPTVRLLAAAFAHRDGYSDEWRP